MTKMTPAEFARHRKVSQKTVSLWKSKGLLVWLDGSVHTEASDAVLDGRPRSYRGGKTSARSANLSMDEEPSLDLDNAMNWTLAEAQRRKEIALALTRELMLQKARGEVVLLPHVKVGWARIVTAARNAMLAVPARLRLTMPHLSRADIEEIGKTIKAALTAAALSDEPPPIEDERPIFRSNFAKPNRTPIVSVVAPGGTGTSKTARFRAAENPTWLIARRVRSISTICSVSHIAFFGATPAPFPMPS
jgi:phage terminase Nu1 subunit (DNA packaging protein)